jgi:ribosomal 30S subunit maturation factor RimM
MNQAHLLKNYAILQRRDQLDSLTENELFKSYCDFYGGKLLKVDNKSIGGYSIS